MIADSKYIEIEQNKGRDEKNRTADTFSSTTVSTKFVLNSEIKIINEIIEKIIIKFQIKHR